MDRKVDIALFAELFPSALLSMLVCDDKTDDLSDYSQNMNERIKVVTSIAALGIKRLRDICTEGEELTWSQLEQTMNECPLIEKRDDCCINKLTTKTLYDIENVKDKADHLKVWFRDLIKQSDSDAYDAMRLEDKEIDFVLDIALKDIDMHRLLNLFVNSVHTKTDILNIRFIHFPTKTHPYLKLYRIRVSNHANETRILFFGSGNMEASVNVELTSRKYYPRMDMFKILSKDVIRQTSNTNDISP
jgi:hypothetical protein